MKMFVHILQHRTKTVLFFLFCTTCLIRIPQLSRPLSKHHELNTAAVLICMQAWNAHGVTSSYGAPIHMFPGTYNIFKQPNTQYPNLIHSGTYLSMGPLSYLAPWAIFKILHIRPTATSLRIWVLFLQWLTVWLLYYLVKKILKPRYSADSTAASWQSWDTPSLSVMACLLLLTAPVSMWFMGNAYCHEVLVLPLYIAACSIGHTIIENKYQWQLKNYLLYGIMIALAVYTDWLGCATALVFFIQALSVKKWKERLPFLLVNAVAVAIPLGLIVWQYSSVVGINEYKNFFMEQLLHRRLPDGGVTFSFLDFIKHFITGYGLLVMAAIAGFVWGRKSWSRSLWMLLSIPLLHYVLFRGFSNEHDYAVLKWAPLIIMGAVLFLNQLHIKMRQMVAIVMVGTGIFLYEYINPPGAKSFTGERYAWMQELGQQIATTAAPNEYIFITTPSYYYQIGWYAQRNYLNVSSEAEAKQWLQYQTGNRGILFVINKEGAVLQTVRFTK